MYLDASLLEKALQAGRCRGTYALAHTELDAGSAYDAVERTRTRQS